MKILFLFFSLQPILSDAIQRQIVLPLSLETRWNGGFSYLKNENEGTKKSSHLSFSKKLDPFHFHALGILEKTSPALSQSKEYWEISNEKLSKYLFGGFSFQSFSFLFDFSHFHAKYPSCYLNIQVHPEKKVYVFQTYEGAALHRGLGILTGESLRIGFELEKIYKEEKEENSGSISLRISLDSILAGGSLKEEDGNSETASTLAIFQKENRNEYYTLSENVYELEKEVKKPKQPLIAKNFAVDFPFRKEKIVYQLTLDELLNKRIDLRNAIQIEKASKNKEDLERLLKTLPTDIAKKVKSLEIEKYKSFEGKK